MAVRAVAVHEVAVRAALVRSAPVYISKIYSTTTDSTTLDLGLTLNYFFLYYNLFFILKYKNIKNGRYNQHTLHTIILLLVPVIVLLWYSTDQGITQPSLLPSCTPTGSDLTDPGPDLVSYRSFCGSVSY